MIIPEVIREKARDFEEKDLEDYITRVIKLLEAMKPGDRLEVANLTKENNRDLFILCVKFYIRKTTYQGGIEFNADFSMIKKYDI